MANKKDLSVMINDVKLNIRVGAIIQYKDKILVEKNKNVDFMVVPGGRIQTLENSHIALLRELQEELGIDLSNEEFKLSSFIENYFTFEDKPHHELYFLYKVNLTRDYNLQNGITNLDNTDSNYYFLNHEEFQQKNILPNVLKEIVLTNEFKHYVVDDLKK